MIQYKSEILSYVDHEEKIKKCWEQLSKSHASHYLHYFAWLEAKMNHIEGKQDAYFYVAYKDSRASIIIPLKLEKLSVSIRGIKFHYSRLVVFSPDEMGVCDGIADVAQLDQSTLTDFWKQLKQIKHWNVASFKNISERSCVYALFNAGRKSDSLKFVSKESHISKYLDSSTSYEAFLARYSKKFVRNLNRKKRRATELGDVELEMVRNDKQAVSAALDIFYELEDSGWKGERKSSLAKQEERKNQYTDFIESVSEQGDIAINLLRLSGQVIAAQVGVYAGNTLYLLKIAYLEEYSQISPGFLAIDALMEKLCAQPEIDRLSFVTGVSWIDVWKPESEKIFVFHRMKNGLANVLFKWAYRVTRK